MPARSLESLAELDGLRSILVIPFEDQGLVEFLRRSHPNTRIDVLSKENMSGGRILRSISSFRKHHYDLVCASLHGGIIRRSPSSARVLLGFFRAHRYALRTDEREVHIRSLPGLFVQTVPRLFVACILGLLFIILSYGYLLTERIALGKRNPLRRASAGKSLLFLRTDLPGAIQSGGSISHVKGMIGAFIKRGFRVTYLADERCEALPSEVRQILIPPIRILDFLDEFQLLAFNAQLWIRRRTIGRHATPTMIYQRHSVFGFSSGFLSRYLRVPAVLEVNASEVWVKEHWSRLFFRHLARVAEAFAVKNADIVSVISKVVRDQLSEQGFHPKNVVVNPNGVDPDEFHPAIDGRPVRRQYGFGKKHIVVGFIGTFAKWHGVETLVEAAIRSLRKRSSLRFLFVGDGGLRSVLEQKVSEFGLGKSIIFTGLIPHSAAPLHLAACDILVSPHLGFDDKTRFFGSPTKLFEYLSMGKPVIASRLEQIGEIIVHKKNGLLMSPGDVDELAFLILLLSRRRDLRSRLGKAGRKHVIGRYTWENNVKRIEHLLDGSVS